MINFSINGKSFSVDKGQNVQIQNGKVIVDGKEVVDTGAHILEVVVKGDLVNLHADGSVSCDNVKGYVQAGGSVQCDDVGGDVKAGGSVNCDRVNGSIQSAGSVNHG